MSADDAIIAEAEQRFRQGDVSAAYDRARLVLRRDRTNAPAHLLMARIAIEQGAYADAIRLCEIAVSLDPAEPAHKAQLAYALVLTGQVVAARAAAHEALASPRASAETLDLIGAVLHAVCDFAAGASALRRAVLLEPDSPALLANLGSMLTICGDVAGACESFRRAIAIAPSLARPYAALSEIRRASAEDNNIAALETLIGESRDPRAAIVLHHALAREFEGLEAYDRAFEVLAKGKAALSAQIGHDPRADDEMFAALHRTIDRRDHRVGHEAADPIFVVGMPRSGTTVVERILTNCTGVESIGESREFARLIATATGTAARRLVDAAALDARWADCDMAAIGRTYADHAAALAPAASRHVDKMPLNLLLVSAIVRALPRSRIICASRNPMDTVVGNYRQMFEFNSDTYNYTLSLEDTASFVGNASALASNLQQAFPENVHVVALEELIANPSREARRITSFCGLLWEEDCTAIDRNLAPIGTASAVQARRGIHPGHIGQWRRYAPFLGKAAAILGERGLVFD